MGLASSQPLAPEGKHFTDIVNPPPPKVDKKAKRNASPEDKAKAEAEALEAARKAASQPKQKKNAVALDPRAKVLKVVDGNVLWEKFLSSTATSFAISYSETAALLKESIPAEAADGTKLDMAKMEEDVDAYLALVAEMSTRDDSSPKVVDMMALCSSILFLGQMPIESKIDQLYQWIVLSKADSLGFDEFFVAMTSFERGLSHAMGKRACTEKYLQNVTTQWLALADPKHKGAADSRSKLSQREFFDFCANRQHVVRRLLEGLSNSYAREDKNSDMQEVVDKAKETDLDKEPTGGDEWMANPAWRKTAGNMVPEELKSNPNFAKPSSNLSLEWVHGYRGFDCRNNARYVNTQGTQMLWHAAALGVVQDCTNAANATQSFFGEHTDDIISMAIYEPSSAYEPNGAWGTPVLIATGELGKQPAIHIYEWASPPNGGGKGEFRSLACMRGFHVKGVCQLAFSTNGLRLFSVGVDYTVALYDTDKRSAGFGKMIGSSQGPKDKVFHCAALGGAAGGSPYDFVSCGEKHAIFWSDENKTLKQVSAKLDKHKSKMIMCAARGQGGVAVLGTSEGDLLLLEGASISQDKIVLGGSKTCHDKAVNALWSSPKGDLIVSGGRDGKVIVWKMQGNGKIEQIKNFAIEGFVAQEGPLRPPIRSVCLSPDCKKVLVGTQTCEIIEFAFPSVISSGAPDVVVPPATVASIARSINVGHYKDELWGLAVRPPAITGGGSFEYATVGDDGYLRIWDIATRKQKDILSLGGMARCCAYSPDSQYLAVGFGGNVGRGKNKEDGMVRVYRTDNLRTAPFELKEAKQWISAIRFSPDGTSLAVGARDNSVYLYSVPQQFKRKAKFSKHNAGILSLDFSSDGKYLQSCCSAYEILFSDAATGAQVTKGGALKDSTWATWTCSLGWAVIGIWAGGMDGSDVNAVSRSPTSKLIAAADDFGKIKVYRYPAIKDGGAQFNCYSGHSSHVTNVSWANLSLPKSATDDILISTGGNDKCVFQWRNSGSESRGGGDVASSEGADSASSSSSHGSSSHSSGFDALDEAPAGGDEFTAVKAWLGAIVAPSAWATPDPAKAAPFFAALGEMGSQHNSLREVGEGQPSVERRTLDDTMKVYGRVRQAAKTVFQKMSESGVQNASVPDGDELELEWVHGYRGFDTRNNVFYVDGPAGKKYVVYHAAALGVLLDSTPGSLKQMYFRGHTDDIMSMCTRINASGKSMIVATGQQAIGNTYVWEISFPNGRDPSIKTLSVLQTKQKSINMLEFSKADGGRLLVSIAEDKTCAVSDWKSQTVLANVKGEGAVTFHMASSSNTSKFSFLSVGDKHIRLWTLDGRNLNGTKVTLGDSGASAMPYLSCAEVKGKFMVGAEDGFIYWTKDMKVLNFGAFPGSAACLAVKIPPKGSKEPRGSKAGSVLSLFCDDCRNLLVSGGKDGSVCVFDTTGWDATDPRESTRPVKVFTMDEVLPNEIMAKQVHSLNARIDASTGAVSVLISTRGCDLAEVTFAAGTYEKTAAVILMRGHCNDELWGVATHPLLPEFVTVGDDKTMRFFSVTQRKMLKAVPLGFMARACHYSPNGEVLAVGFGGRVGKGKEPGGGILRLYPANHRAIEGQMEKLAEAKDAKEWISDVKFSSDGRTLCVGAHDCKIYIYTVTIQLDERSTATNPFVTSATLKLRSTFGKHSSVINHIDLSADGRFMQSNCSAYELLFSDTTTGKQITSAQELKDVKWDTWTCTLGWPVQGIWGAGEGGSDINAVARSNSGHLVALSDDFGKVRLYRYPCIKEGSQCLSYGGHSSHVTNVRWTAADECLISCGGNDKTIMQWAHVMAGGSTPPPAPPSSSAGGGGHAHAHSHHDDVSASGGGGGGEHHDAGASAHGEQGGAGGGGDHHGGGGEGDDPLGAPSGGDESGCVKPWLGAVRTPKNPPPVNANAPAVSLELQWVHGFTSGSAGAGNVRISNNLFYAADRDPVFPAAALGVRMLRGADGVFKQKYFRKHDDDILCLAISKDRRFVATGQTATTTSKGKGSICVWDASDCRQLCRMDQCHQRGVSSLSFSPEGNQLLSVGMDDKNTHILWTDAGGSWSRVQKTVETPSDGNAVLFARWMATDAQTPEAQLVTGGGQVANFWKIEGATLMKKAGRFGKKKQCPLLSAANVQTKEGWRMVIGTATGDLYIFLKGEVINAVEKAHNNAILCLAEGNAECSFLVSGSRDKSVRVWNSSLQPISSFDVSSLSIVDGSVASLDVRPPESKAGDNLTLTVLVGTYGGEVIEVSSLPEPKEGGGAKGGEPREGESAGKGAAETRNLDLADADAKVILYSHFNGELWGCCTHPLDADLYATVGDDSTLRIWSIRGNCLLKSVNIGWPGRSVAWHPSGGVIAVGFHEAVKGGVAKKAAAGAKAPAAAKPAAASEDGIPAPHAGAVHLYSVRQVNGAWEIKKRADGCDSAAWIGDIKFSPNGRVLACGSHDKRMYAYDLPEVPDYSSAGNDEAWDKWSRCLAKPKFAFNKHSSSVNHFDFSLDGKYLQSNCQAAELLFCEINATPSGKQETSATKMAEYYGKIEDDEYVDRVWATQTCKLGWPVQGIWPPGADTGDINSVDRSTNGKLLATADDHGQVKLFRYPAVTENSKFLSFDGHSSHVTCVRFSIANHLISVGGNDKCTFVWAINEE